MTTTESHLALVPRPPCRDCTKPADGLDRLCTPCRAESACHSLTETLTDALENFLDDRWFPHEFGHQRPAYYRDAPDFAGDPLAYEARIAGAYAQVAPRMPSDPIITPSRSTSSSSLNVTRRPSASATSSPSTW